MSEPTATTYRPTQGATLRRVQVEIYADDNGERFMVSDTGMHFDTDIDLGHNDAEQVATKRVNYYTKLGHEVTLVRPALD